MDNRAFLITGIDDAALRNEWAAVLGEAGFSNPHCGERVLIRNVHGAWRRFVHGEPDGLRWWLTPSSRGQWLHCAAHVHAWRVVAGAVLAGLTAFLPAKGLAIAQSSRGTMEIVTGAIVVALGVGAAFCCVHLVTPFERTARLVHDGLRRRLENAGGCVVDQADRLAVSRVISLAVLALFLIPLSPYIILVLSNERMTPEGIAGPLWTLLALAAVVLVLLVPSVLARKEIAWRLGTMGPALWFLLAFIGWSLGTYFHVFWGAMTTDHWMALMTAEDWLRHSHQSVYVTYDGTTVERAKIASTIGRVRFLFAGSLAISLVVCPLVSVWMAWMSLRGAAYAVKSSNIVGSTAAHSVYRQAAEGTSTLWIIRLTLVLLWFGLVLGAILTAGAAFAAPIRWLMTDASETKLGMYRASYALFDIVLGRSFPAVTVDVAVAAAWSFWLAIPGALWVWFIGTCWRYRRSLERRLQSAIRFAVMSEQAAHAPVINESDMAGIRLAVTPSSALVCAHAFGLVRPRRYIEFGAVALAELSEPEQLAILRHEMAHHFLGHCQRHNLLRWAGRMTLVGAGFVGPLEDSYRLEVEADKFAVDRLGASASALADALMKLRALAGLEIFEAHVPRGLGADRMVVGRPAPEDGRPWGAWMTLFAADCEIAYWHPALEDRLERLRSMSKVAAKPHE